MKNATRICIAAVTWLGIAAGPSAAAKLSFPLTSPFNVSAKKLTPGFIGHDVGSVYEALSGKQPPKGEFESSAAFKARVTRIRANPLYGSVYMWSPLGFVVAPDRCEYDADTQILKAIFRATSRYGDISDGLGILTDYWENSADTYQAQNGFGAPVTVSRRSVGGYGLALSNARDFWFAEGYGNGYILTYAFKVKPERARALKRDLRAVFVGYCTTPYRSDWANYKTPKYHDPEELIVSFEMVNFRLKSIWFYDDSSGYIFSRMGPKPRK